MACKETCACCKPKKRVARRRRPVRAMTRIAPTPSIVFQQPYPSVAPVVAAPVKKPEITINTSAAVPAIAPPEILKEAAVSRPTPEPTMPSGTIPAGRRRGRPTKRQEREDEKLRLLELAGRSPGSPGPIEL